MIPTKSRRLKATKLSKNIDKLYKEGKCRECAVVVTRMDFAKILGKFTKVKIQYETSKKPKGKSGTEIYTKSKQKTNENGIIQQKRCSNNLKANRSNQSKENDFINSRNSVLRENNRLEKHKNFNCNSKVSILSKFKQYGIIFTSPVRNNKNYVNKMSLVELLPKIDESILPSKEWCIDYFPKNDEPKDDKVYDRIAAELEDLMNNGKSVTAVQDKSDDFPSIMDILNDDTLGTLKSTDQNDLTGLKSNTAPNDVESILLGKPDISKTLESTQMDVDNTDVSNLIADVDQFNVIQPVNPIETSVPEACISNDVDNPNSPSILDEALQKGIEEHLPPCISTNTTQEETSVKPVSDNESKPMELGEDLPSCINSNTTQKDSSVKPLEKMTDDNELKSIEENEVGIKSETKDVKVNVLATKAELITEVVFKLKSNGNCYKSVTCPKSLKYKVELDGKLVEFIGAPKYISNLDDLQILLQIVNDSDLKSFYVLQ